MPILDGYDDLDLGPKRFPAGEYTALIEGAKLVSGKTQAGNQYTALDIEVANEQYRENVRIFLPRDNQDWQTWEDWQRKKFKRQLAALGIRPEQVEDETARERLLGTTIGLFVTNKKTGDGTNVHFQEEAGKDAGLPLPPQAPPATAPAFSL